MGDRFLKARERLLDVWKDDGRGIDGLESARQPLLLTLRQASSVGFRTKVGEPAWMVLAEILEELEKPNPSVDRLFQEACDLQLYRCACDDEFASYIVDLGFNWDLAPKEM